MPIKLFGMELSLGGDLRPYYRMTGKIDSRVLGSVLQGMMEGTTDPDEALMQLPVDCGYSLAIDLGALLKVGPFTAGLSVRGTSPPPPNTRESRSRTPWRR